MAILVFGEKTIVVKCYLNLTKEFTFILKLSTVSKQFLLSHKLFQNERENKYYIRAVIYETFYIVLNVFLSWSFYKTDEYRLVWFVYQQRLGSEISSTPRNLVVPDQLKSDKFTVHSRGSKTGTKTV